MSSSSAVRSLLAQGRKIPAATNIITYHESSLGHKQHYFLQMWQLPIIAHRELHLCSAHTNAHTSTVCLMCASVPVWQMCCFCGVWIYYHLPFIWGHEGVICYLDNEWCSLENLPITSSVKAVMRPTALLPWRPEARFFFLTPMAAIVFIWIFALVVNFTVNLSLYEQGTGIHSISYRFLQIALESSFQVNL